MEIQDSDPQYVPASSPYNLLNKRNFIDESACAESLLMSKSVSSIPGGWLYRSFLRNHIRISRFLHIAGYSIELICYVIGQSWVKFQDTTAEDSFALDPIFVTICWGILIILGGILIFALFHDNIHSISVLGQKLRLVQLPFYGLLSMYFISNIIFTKTIVLIFNDICLFLLLCLSFYLYYEIKYEDDGRYIVTWIDYFGIHAHFSIFCAWILVELCHNAILTADNIENEHHLSLLGWDSSNWTICIMCVEFGLSVIVLSTFKDIFFAGTMSYNFFGIFSLQERGLCKRCDREVKLTSVVMGSLMISFVLLIVLLYSKKVCYNVRRRRF